MQVSNILSWITYLPAAAAVMLLLFRRESLRAMKWFAFMSSVIVFLLALYPVYRMDPGTPGMQFEESVPWIRAGGYTISHHLGVDGISLFLVVLTAFLTPLALLASWNSISRRLKSFLMCMLLLETGMVGVFCALDLVLFYVFWEVMLIPMYFLIGVWGGERRVYAAVKFILYTMVGSLLMLVAIIYLCLANGGTTFDLQAIQQNLASGALQLTHRQELWLFLAFLVAFAIKVPMFPLHTWLPDAHVEAPTAGSVILAGVLLKMGTYGILRFCLPLFPTASQTAAPYLIVLGLIGIVYGALVAMVQPDIKKLVAYSSVSHMGLIIVGIFAFTIQGLQGATLQMLNHGLSTGALFLLVGMIYDRRHTRLIADFGGLAHGSPALAVFFMIVTLSSIGLPGLNGFVGEVLVLAGTFLKNRTYAAVAATGMILGAVYMLWMYQRVFLGAATVPANRQMGDISRREKCVLIPVVVLMVWMGVYPAPFLRRMEASLHAVQQRVHDARGPEGGYHVRNVAGQPGTEGAGR